MLLKSADESAQAEGQAIFTQLRHATGILEPEDFHDLPLWAVVGKMGRIDYAASVEDHASPVKTGLASLCDTAPRRSRAEDGDTVFPIRDRPGQRIGSLRHKGRWAASPPGPSAFIGDENASSLPPSSNGKECAMFKRRRFTQLLSLSERLYLDAARLRIQSERLHQNAARLRVHAEKLPRGTERETLIGWARQAETASDIDEWPSSPGLQAPS